MTLAASNEGNSLNPMSFCDQHGAVVLERLRYERETGRFTDVVIRVPGKQFAAHRNVLAACSPYFDAILKANVVTKEQVTVNCKNSMAFELLLNYMYSGSVVIDRGVVSELLRLANNLLITKMKNYCAEYLDRNLDAANCLSVKHLATKYNLPSLLKTASEFFDMNINRCLLECVDLLSFTAAQLDRLIRDPRYHNVISPDVHLRLIVRWGGYAILARAAGFKSLLLACPLQKVTQSTLEYILDISPLLVNDPPTRLYLLSQLVQIGVGLGKYEDEYARLMGQMGDGTLHMQPAPIDDYDDQVDTGSEAGVEGEPTAGQILSRVRQPYVASLNSSDEAAPVKLKIKLGKRLSKEDRMHRKLEKELRRKKRRQSGDEAGTSNDNRHEKIDEDAVDGVLTVGDEAVLFPEPDGIDPSTLDDEEEENVHGGQYVCLHCRFATNEIEDLQRHTAKRHDRNTIFVCTMCDGFEANWSAAFYEHVATHFDKTTPLRCDQCEFTAEDGIHMLLSHRLSHTGGRPFKCGTCGWTARTRVQLWAHERIHSGDAAFSCRECGRGFRREDALNMHTATHEEPRLHVCVDCGWAARTDPDLLAHRAVSHQVDVYSCHIEGCDYISTKKSQLAAHLRTHLAVRAHLCRICGRGFIEKSHVVRHERIHLEDKPFKCESCEYASSRRDKLKEHILKYHNGATNVKQTLHRRRYRRAKQLAQAMANHQQKSDVLFRPIESNRERIEQWQNSLNASTSVIPQVQNNAYYNDKNIQLIGSMSLMNVPLGMGGEDSPMPMLHPNKDILMSEGLRLEESSLVTPVPRSPHNHSDPFAMNMTDESQRPMSLPPYGGNWFT